MTKSMPQTLSPNLHPYPAATPSSFSRDAIRPSLTICICTSGRTALLRRCLESVAAGTKIPNQVLVADDSRTKTDRYAVRECCGAFNFVRYVQGPGQGLCRNRNCVISEASTSHVSLLDDDATVGREFVQDAMQAIEAFPYTIFSGSVLESGVTLTPPTNPTLWGHFGRLVAPGDPLRNIHLNCNIIPRRAFADAAFDENLVYGYEDTDLCDRLVRAGWRIEHDTRLVNEHHPPNPGDRSMLAERERFAVLLRMRSGPGLARLAVAPWAVLAAGHAVLSYARRRQWNWIVLVPAWTLRGAWIAMLDPVPSRLEASQPCNVEGFTS